MAASTQKPQHTSHVTHFALALIAIGSSVTVLGTSVYRVQADPPDMSSSAPGNSRTDGEASASGGGGGGNYMNIYRAPQDNSQSKWRWNPSSGWTRDAIEETYQNGWSWVWRENGWSWEQDASRRMSSVPAVARFEDQQSSASSDPGCFASDGSWVTDRRICAADQKSAAAKADPTDVPEVIRAIARDTAPLTTAGEAAVLQVMSQRFDAALADAARRTAERVASDVLGRLTILKNAGGVTENERQYFIGRIVEVQKILAGAGDAEDPESMADALASVTKEVAGFVREHGITTQVPDAPTAPAILAKSKRILSALPKAFDVLDGAGYSTENLRSMHAATALTADDITARCAVRSRDCGDVADVVEQIQKMVTILGEMVQAAGNSALKADIEKQFDAAF
jgi:hypothetical protein